MDLRAIAFYLPQFHPIPENDAWWGDGFTEWTNTRKARPLFSGHHQPHIPGSLGYYDLRDPRARAAQADLAQEYGIHGFCYYHYWFSGKRLLETPFNEVLRSGEPRLPFCLCWANEGWSRRWDGRDREVLMPQRHSAEDDKAFIEALIPAFRDDRYIRVNGKPILLLYRSALLPDPKRTAAIWRDTMHEAGVGDLYLVRVENLVDHEIPPPSSIDFDAAAEFAPHWQHTGGQHLEMANLYPDAADTIPDIYDYNRCMLSMLARPKPAYKLFRGVFPSWDNSPRRRIKPTIFVNSSPEAYAFWLSQIARYTLETLAGDERLIFINAWNEWGEGCHLEPDERSGLAHLEATRNALRLASDMHSATTSLGMPQDGVPFDQQRWYQLLTACYAGRAGLTAEEAETLAAFCPYVLFAMLPLFDANVSSQLKGIIAEKEKALLDLQNSVCWRITAPLRTFADFVLYSLGLR